MQTATLTFYLPQTACSGNCLAPLTIPTWGNCELLRHTIANTVSCKLYRAPSLMPMQVLFGAPGPIELPSKQEVARAGRELTTPLRQVMAWQGRERCDRVGELSYKHCQAVNTGLGRQRPHKAVATTPHCSRVRQPSTTHLAIRLLAIIFVVVRLLCCHPHHEDHGVKFCL